MTNGEVTSMIKKIIVEKAELDQDPESISNEALLFGPAGEGGLELDSLTALEIFFAVGDAFALPDLADADERAFGSVRSLAEFIQAAGTPGLV